MPFPPAKIEAYKAMRAKKPMMGGKPGGPPMGGGKPNPGNPNGGGKPGGPPMMGGKPNPGNPNGGGAPADEGKIAEALAPHMEALQDLCDECPVDLSEGAVLEQEDLEELQQVVDKFPPEVEAVLPALASMPLDKIEAILDKSGGEGVMDHNRIAGLLFHAARL